MMAGAIKNEVKVEDTCEVKLVYKHRYLRDQYTRRGGWGAKERSSVLSDCCIFNHREVLL